MNEEAYWNALRRVYDFGITQFTLLKKHFRSARQAFEAPKSKFRKFDFAPKLCENLKLRDDINVKEEYEKMKDASISLLVHGSEEFPKILHEIASPPPLLYVRGNVALLKENNLIAVVGTRKATSYGKAATQRIVTELAQNECTIVSGMAYGIDAEAHRTTLTNRGNTIAILGSGLDDPSIYPQAHKGLAREILKKGLLVSEFPVGTKPRPEYFPRRNRVISGLSRGVVVVEAKDPSGALITALCALEQNREVFAVPGSIFAETSKGCHRLLTLGARLTETAQDIFLELRISPDRVKIIEQNIVLRCLGEKRKNFDEILHQTKLSSQELLSEITLLEMQGRVAKNSGMYYKV